MGLGVLLSASESRPGMQLNILQCLGQPLSSSSNVISAKVEKCWPRDTVASFMIYLVCVCMCAVRGI